MRGVWPWKTLTLRECLTHEKSKCKLMLVRRFKELVSSWDMPVALNAILQCTHLPLRPIQKLSFYLQFLIVTGDRGGFLKTSSRCVSSSVLLKERWSSRWRNYLKHFSHYSLKGDKVLNQLCFIFRRRQNKLPSGRLKKQQQHKFVFLALSTFFVRSPIFEC